MAGGCLVISLCAVFVFVFVVLPRLSCCGGKPRTSPDDLGPIVRIPRADHAAPYVANATFSTGFVTYSRDLPRFWEDAMSDAGVKGQDGGESVPYPSGALWAFGDTEMSWRLAHPNTALYLRKVANSTELFHVQYVRDAHAAVCILPLAGTWWCGDNRIWPFAGLLLGDMVYLWYILITKTGSGVWDFRGEPGLSKTSIGSFEFQPLAPPPGSKWPFLTDAAVILPADGRIYMLFHLDSDQGKEYVARVLPGDLEQPEQYEYFCGFVGIFDPVWLRNISRRQAIMDNCGYPSVFWHARLQRYLLLHSYDLWNHPHDLYISIVRNPWGPIEETRLVYHKPGAIGPDLRGIIKTLYWHPELFVDDRVLYLTYCIEGEDKPHLVQIDIDVIRDLEVVL